MKNYKSLDSYSFNKNLLKKYFKKLFPICRSIMGEGFRQSLNIIGELVDLKKINVKSGTKVLDWTVPKEWNIDDAYIVTPSGKKIADFKKNNLHIVNYSQPINKILDFKELKKRLFFIKKMPSAIPYITSYYRKFWGFCLTYNDFKKLPKKGRYKVVIKSKIKNGNLVYSDNLIKGKSKKEILFSTYLCHPSMANNELSGPLVWSMLYKIIKNTGPHYYSYRFLIAPENIGAAAFLQNSKKKIKNIIAGYIINCVGVGKEFTYKRSRIGNSLADKSVINLLANSDLKYSIIDFYPDGSDERQFCSPGFNMPIGLIMRKAYNKFPEYHTSLDNEKLISFQTLEESINFYKDVVKTIENNFIPVGKVLYGSPQLSKSKIPLYSNLMNYKNKPKSQETRFILEIINNAEGKKDLLTICNEKKFRLIDYIETVNKLLRAGYIKKRN